MKHVWIVTLDCLDSAVARYRHVDPRGGPSTAEFKTTREQWEAMGCPSQVAVTVQSQADL